MTNYAVKIEGLTKTYSNGVQAIKGIDLKIEEGDFFALLGSNGAGKTTTIGVLTDLVRKTSGNVEIFGINIDENFSGAKYNVGVVPQEFNFNIFAKVIDIVTTQAGYYGISLDEALPRAKEVLEKLGLTEKMNMQAMTLSGGMKRRLMIARALVHKPKLLILDEPTAGVDAQLRIGMWEYLKEINEKDGVTILLTTHYLEEVEQLCKRAAIINKGKIVKLDTVRNLLNSMEKESYIIDLKNLEQSQFESLKKIKELDVSKTDDNTIEIIVPNSTSVNELVSELDKIGLIVTGIRPKGNRLETLFLDIVES